MAKSFSVFVNIGGRVGSSFTTAISTVENKVNGLTRRFKEQAAAAKAAMKGMGEAAKAAAALAAAGGISFGVKHALGDGAELNHEIQALKNAGRTAHEVADGMAAANKAMLSLPSSSLSESLKILNETTGAFGDFHHALENLDFNIKLGDVLKNAIGDKMGDPGQMFNKIVRAFEIRGTAGKAEDFQREAGELARAMIFTRGNVNPDEFLNFAQRGNPAIKMLSERFLTKIAPSLIQELGGDIAGTGLTAFRKVVKGGLSDSIQAQEWVKLGLVDKGQVRTNKAGQVQGWKSGAVKDTDTAFQDPLKWMEDTVLPAIQKAGVDINDPIALAKELDVLFKNVKSNAFASAIAQVKDRTRLHKDEALINQVPGLDKTYWENLQNDVKPAMRALKAALGNLGAALTLPLMKPAARVFTSIAVAINKLASVLVENPGLAKALGVLVAAMAGAAAIKLASFIFGITGLGRALVFLALSAPFGLAGQLVGVARGITAIVAATALGAIGRLRALAVGLMALTSVGGVRLALMALAGGFVALGRAILMLPLTLLRGAFTGHTLASVNRILERYLSRTRTLAESAIAKLELRMA